MGLGATRALGASASCLRAGSACSASRRGRCLFLVSTQARDLFADIAFGALPGIAQAWLMWASFFAYLVFLWAFPVHYAARRLLDTDVWMVSGRLRDDVDAAWLTDIRRALEGPIDWIPRILAMVPFAAVLVGLWTAYHVVAEDAGAGAGPRGRRADRGPRRPRLRHRRALLRVPVAAQVSDPPDVGRVRQCARGRLCRGGDGLLRRRGGAAVPSGRRRPARRDRAGAVRRVRLSRNLARLARTHDTRRRS